MRKAPGCAANRWCIYTNANWGGAWYFARDSDRSLKNNNASDGHSINDRGSSVWNNRDNRVVRFYTDNWNWNGRKVCVRPYTGIRNLARYKKMNDAISAVLVNQTLCG
ncbi:peptidase inhibitor family I36 protein [Actinoallomurus purpureus]|uniref:peptidase inhibitor family I36 protein n=1 Tax=Actinoallomurus purpureus TaxID=478114 RepID=UPI003556EF25